MAKIKIGDDAKVGAENFEKSENGGTYQSVNLEEKNYTREGVVARIAVLETELAKFQSILADIDKE